jgi:hypothetical protein
MASGSNRFFHRLQTQFVGLCIGLCLALSVSAPATPVSDANPFLASKAREPLAPAVTLRPSILTEHGRALRLVNQRNDELHTPPMGSAERKAIMDSLRKDQGDEKVVFKVHHLKVHAGWAWVDVTPLDEKGSWKVMDLTSVPEGSDDPLGPEDPTPKYVKSVQQTFPGVPADIFPKKH